jgi:hypothetical protein
MDVISMGVMDCTVSIVDLQARERPQTLVIQISATKDETELLLSIERLNFRGCMSFIPKFIESIDAIALQAQRDVLYVKFSFPFDGTEPPAEHEYKRLRYWQTLPGREACIAWLDEHCIDYKLCYDFLPESDAGAQVPYCIYIDLVFDKSGPLVQALMGFLTYPDGSMKFADATLCHLSLERAIAGAV